MASLQSRPHDGNVSGAVEGVVQTSICDIDEVLLDRLVDLGGVDKLGRAKLLCPLLLLVIDINGDNSARSLLDGTLDNRETNASRAEDGNGRALLHLGGDNGSTVAGGDTAAQETCAVHSGIGTDGDDGNIGYDGELREGRCAHKVEEILALALEAGGAVRHDAAALGGPDLAAEIRLQSSVIIRDVYFSGANLSRLAELALAALGL